MNLTWINVPSRPWRLRAVAVGAATVLTAGIAASPAVADGPAPPTPGVVPHSSRVPGVTYAQWSAAAQPDRGTSAGEAARVIAASAGGQFKTYPGISDPWWVATGPDGALWFTNPGNNSVGRITTAGKVTTYTGTGINAPHGITAGPDGALWFTNNGGNSIGRITTAGKVTTYTGTGISSPEGITAGPAG